LGWVRQPAHLAAIVIVLLGATTGIYYAVFLVFTLLVAGVIAGLARFDHRRVFSTLALSAAAAVVLLVQFIPVWMLHRQIGPNLEIKERSLIDIEYYSLKLSDLVLPVNGHRFQVLADLWNESLELWPLRERAEAIGLVGLVGLVLLALVASARLVRGLAGGRHGAMALIAGAVFVLGTVGGGATVLGVFGLTYLRAWGRISVVVAFCAFAAVGIGLDRVRSRLRGSYALFVMALVVTIGVLDTNPHFPFVPYDHMANAWASDKAFVHRVEDLLGEDAEIFQLPIVPFPENPPVYRMSDYDHLRAYLHSDTLGWSYGGVKGRASDWQQRLAGLSADELAEAVAGVGFDGLWLDRFGYGSELAEIETLLGLPALESDDGRLAVYDLRPVRAALVENLGSDVVERDAAVLIEPVTVGLGEGFYGLELGAGRRFSWAPERAEIRLRNPTTDTRSVLFSFVAASAVEGQWVLDVEGLPAISRFPLTTDGTFVNLTIEVPSGGLSLRLRTDAPRLETTDPREIRFRILDPLIEPAFD
jgi:phosphoglycerol transferase